MKISLAFALLFCLAVHASGQLAPSPQSPPRHHSLTLEAQSIANGGTVNVATAAGTREGTVLTTEAEQVDARLSIQQDRHDTSNRTNVRVSIRNLATLPDHLTLEWYFVAAPIGLTAQQYGNKDFVFDHGSQALSLKANAADNYVVASKRAKSVATRSLTVIGGTDDTTDVAFVGGSHTTGTVSQQGIVQRGWFVRLVDNGRVIAARGSSQTYEDLAKDDSKIKLLVSQPPPPSQR